MNTQSDKGIFDGDDIFNEIVGGRETEPSNYPYIVTIQVNGYHYCGGSILRTEYPAMVLTAAHCYKNPNYNHVVVRLYAKDADASYNHNTNNYIDTSIWDTAIHPGYNPNTLDNDIMVIWLNEGIEQYPQLRPVIIEPNAIPSGGNLECCHHDEPLQVIGYGNDCFSCQNTPTLEYVDLGYMDRSMCKPEFYGRSHQVTDNMLCAAELPNGGSDACQGDSGGPLIIAGTNKQIGIVSWGIGCATHYPGVYTDIGIFYDWIQQKMYQQMDDGQRKEMELMMDQNRKMDSVFIVKSQYYYYFGMSVSGVLLVTAILYCCKNREYEAILEKEENVFMPIC